MLKMHNFHYIIGFTFLVLFLATGGYLNSNFPELYGENEVMRFMYRSNHIYILMAALINLGLGSYLRYSFNSKIKVAQKFGGVLVLSAPFILFAAFFVEPIGMLVDRPITFWGILALLIGVVVHAGSSIVVRREIQPNQ